MKLPLMVAAIALVVLSLGVVPCGLLVRRHAEASTVSSPFSIR